MVTTRRIFLDGKNKDGSLRLVYYTRPGFLDHGLERVRRLSRLVEAHLLLEVSPRAWRTNILECNPRALSSGVVRADPVLRGCFPSGICDYWKDVASFNLVVYKSLRVFRPGSLRTNWQASSFLRAIRPDLIHFDDIGGHSALLAAMVPGVPKVVSIHDPAPHAGEPGRRAQIIRRMALQSVSRVIFHSEHCRNVFYSDLSANSDTSSVVPLGVLDIFREWQTRLLPEEPATVLFFGRISPYKGVETLLAAAPSVAARVPGVRFVIAGRPIPGYQIPEPPALSNEGTFEMHLDYISNAMLCDLFQRAALVVLPYIEASQSGVLMTAYAFHKPVVVTRTGGIPEFVEDGKTGRLVPPGDPAALADAIVELLRDPVRRRAMSEHIAEKERGALSWDRIAEMTVDVYRQVVAEHRRR